MHACLYYSSVNPIWCGFIITFARCFFAHFAVLRFLEQCAMIVSCTISVQTFFRRTSICEIVECYRSPKPVFWRRLGLRMTVISEIRGGKDHEATHDRQNFLIARLHVATPELEMPSVAIGPIVVHVHERVDSTIQLVRVVSIKIGVNVQVASRCGDVQARTSVDQRMLRDGIESTARAWPVGSVPSSLVTDS